MIIFTITQARSRELSVTLDSLMSLSCVDWLLVYEETQDSDAGALLDLMRFADERIVPRSTCKPGSAICDFVMPLLPGDEVLQRIECIAAGAIPAEAAWAYSDSVLRTDKGNLVWAKPGFSPELQFATNYIQRPIFRGSHYEDFFIQAEYEIYARFPGWCNAFGPIFHIQQALFTTASLFTDTKKSLAAVRDSAEAYAAQLGYTDYTLGVRSEYSEHLRRKFHAYDLVFEDSGPDVTVIIPTKDHADLLKACIDSIREKTSYRNYRIMVIDNNSQLAETAEYLASLADDPRIDVRRILNPPGKGFNFAYINNVAVRLADSELVCFLNNDTEILHPSWLTQMVGLARNQQVGSVGALLLYPNMVVQHSGIHFGLLYNKLPVTAFKHLPERDGAYFGALFAMRNYMALSAACLVTRRDTFLDTGGFDEENFGVAYNDCDLGIRFFMDGKRNVFCPDAVVVHHEGYTRGTGIGNDNPSEEAAFLRMHDEKIDPFYNRWLAADSSNCELRRNPRYPILARQGRRNIVAYTHNLNYEGAPLVLFDLVSQLCVDAGYRFTVISPCDGLLADRYRALDVEVRVRPSFAIGMAHTEDSLEGLLAGCRAEIEALRGDLVLSNTVLGFPLVLAARQLELPALWVIHESEEPFTHLREHGGVAEYFAKVTAQAATEVVFVCESTREYYKHQLALRENTSVIYNAVDLAAMRAAKRKTTKLQARRRLRIDPEVKVGLCVGSVCARKRQQDIAAIMEQLDEKIVRNLLLVIVGDRDGTYSDELHRKVKALGERGEHIRIVAETPNPVPYFIAADFFLFCSGMESYPRVLQEALCFDLPVVTTKVFGNREIVSGNRNGLFFDVGDVKAAAAHVERLCSDEKFFRAMVDHCAPALGRFSTMNKFAASYKEIIDAALSA